MSSTPSPRPNPRRGDEEAGGDEPSDETAATVVVVINGDQVVVSRLDGRIDLALVDRLARLTLEARRRGAAVRLHDPPPELRQPAGAVRPVRRPALTPGGP